MSEKSLTGARLAGYNANKDRAKHDYYATPLESTVSLMELKKFKGNSFLEPCVGQGHISKTILEYYPNSKVYGMDIVERELINGNEDLIFYQDDFLKHEFNEKFDNIITNPPFSLSKEFVVKCLDLLEDGGELCMFLKIQFLEGISRRSLFDEHPPKSIHVFTKRQTPLKNGSLYDENGKKISGTLCLAWFVWEKGFKGKPVIEWI